MRKSNWMTPLAYRTRFYRTSESSAISIIFEQAIHRISKWIEAVQSNCLTDILVWFICALLNMFKKCIYA